MSFRDALQTYIDNPEKHIGSVLFSDDNVVIIKDSFPKSIQHLLILPRRYTHVHPIEVFKKDHGFYSTIEKYIPVAKKLMLDNLISENWSVNNEQQFFQFIKVGIHAIPSLRNLHIHVITKDFYSARLKNKKHYNSFNTDFFVDFEKLNPIVQRRSIDLVDQDTDTESGDENEVVESHSHEVKRISKDEEKSLINSPLLCVWCGRNFDNKFTQLKVHLAQEFKDNFGRIAKKVE